MEKNEKMTVIALDKSTLKPVSSDTITYRGTEPGHFYVGQTETDDYVVGARDLTEDCSVECPEDGVESRIRFILKNESKLSDSTLKCFLESLGFTSKKYAGETEEHFSVVTKKPATVLAAVSFYLAAR